MHRETHIGRLEMNITEMEAKLKDMKVLELGLRLSSTPLPPLSQPPSQPSFAFTQCTPSEWL